MIYWSEFSWEAFATILAGLFAVFAAVIVGMRQTKILERQAKVQELSVRSDLFDRRYENYETVRDFLMEALRLTGEPDQAAMQKFFNAQREARFLFGPEVHDGLELIWKDCCELFDAANLVRQGSNDRGAMPEGYDYQTEVQRRFEFSKKVSLSHRNLHELYHQLRLDI